MNYATIKFPDVANGEGVRVSLFVSGCRNRCKGCFNPETWSFGYGKPFTEDVERQILEKLTKNYIKGLSILGGDPMEPENQAALLPFLRKVKKLFPEKDVWMWTGYEYERIWDSPILEYVDILVDGRFDENKKDLTIKFRGSTNQRILNLNHKCGDCYWFKEKYCYNWLHPQESWKIKACWSDEAPSKKLLERKRQEKEYVDLYKKLRSDEMNNTEKIRGFELVKGAPADTVLPTRKTKGSAGYDFYLPCDVVVPARGFTEIIQTGIKAYMPQEEVLLLHIRSSIGLLKHITLANCTGIIDSDFYNNPDNEGNIGFVLQNNSDTAQVLHKGDRIMQGVFVRYGVADGDTTTGERKGGTGSTGK